MIDWTIRCALATALLAGACELGTGEPDQCTEVAAVIGGTAATADDAVVLLAAYPPERDTWYSCTASVIAPGLLLTAAHCVDAPNHPDFLYGAFLGQDARFLKPVFVGDVLTSRFTVSSVEPKTSGNSAVVQFDIDLLNSAGDTVLSGHHRYLLLCKAGAEGMSYAG